MGEGEYLDRFSPLLITRKIIWQQQKQDKTS